MVRNMSENCVISSTVRTVGGEGDWAKVGLWCARARGWEGMRTWNSCHVSPYDRSIYSLEGWLTDTRMTWGSNGLLILRYIYGEVAHLYWWTHL